MKQKIAFFVHFPELVNHYGSTWSALAPESFEIVIECPTQAENDFMFEYASENKYSARKLEAVIANNVRYRITVSNHPFAAGHQNGIANLWALGDIHVRVMYALGKAQWNFAPWNSHYNTVFCWGRYHEECLADFSHLKKIQVGYPRLDLCFTKPTDKNRLQKEFKLSPEKKTLLWLPTWRSLSSIDDFSPHIKKLKSQYNLLIKVHPNTLTEEPEKMAMLEQCGLQVIEQPYLNNYQLIEIADCVLADYGGSAFAAIYLDKPILLLNIDGAENDELTGPQSLDILLRQWLPNISIQQASQLDEILLDEALWQPPDDVYQELKNYLFKPTNGKSGKLMANELMKTLNE